MWIPACYSLPRIRVGNTSPTTTKCKVIYVFFINHLSAICICSTRHNLPYHPVIYRLSWVQSSLSTTVCGNQNKLLFPTFLIHHDILWKFIVVYRWIWPTCMIYCECSWWFMGGYDLHPWSIVNVHDGLWVAMIYIHDLLGMFMMVHGWLWSTSLIYYECSWWFMGGYDLHSWYIVNVHSSL